jgi:type II secretory pathway component GspD/PulD (secretin)
MALGATIAIGRPPESAADAATGGPAPLKAAHVHGALNSGIDSYRRGDYEAAQILFRQAQEGRDELSPEDRQELDNMVHLNTAALKARAEGAELLKQAEQATKAGKVADADALVKQVATNQFLTAADKERVHRLIDQAHGGSDKNGATDERYIHPLLLARNKVHQARQLMAKANYEAAETLAKEAAQLKANFRPGEDTPQRVLDDIARIRADAKKLLISARIALDCGDLDRAEALAHASEKAASSWTFSALWGDSPARVLKDIQARRPRTVAANPPAKSKPTASKTATETAEKADAAGKTTKTKTATESAKAPATNNNEMAHQLVKQGRTALKHGDVDKAKEYALHAEELKGSFHWWEDNPKSLSADVERAISKQERARDNAPAGVAKVNASPTKDEAQSMLKNARELLAAGKLEEAEKVALQAKKTDKKEYGLFDDSPDMVLNDIRNVRAAHAKRPDEQAAMNPAQVARNDGAHMPPPEGFMNPSQGPKIINLRDDTAQASQAVRAHAAAVPASGNVPTPKAETPQPAFQPMPVAVAPAVPPAKQKAIGLLAEARKLQAENRLVEARQKALEAQKSGAVFTVEEDSPERALLQLTEQAHKWLEQLQQEAVDFAATGFVDPTRFGKAEDNLKQARKLAMDFSLDTQAIDSRMGWVQRARSQAASSAQPAATPASESVQLASAQTVAPNPPSASDPGANTQPALAQPTPVPVPEPVQPAPTPTPPPMVAPAPIPVNAAPAMPPLPDKLPEPEPPGVAHVAAASPAVAQPQVKAAGQPSGQELLDRARLEIQRGELETARRLAVEAYTGPYNVQAEADAVLHTIDAEEFNRKTVTANRTFEAGAAALARKDYAHAAAILKSVDAVLLPPEKQAKLKELLSKAELLQKTPEADIAKASSVKAKDPSAPAESGTPEANYAKQVQAMQEVKFQELRVKSLNVQKEATDRVRNGDTAQAVEILQAFLTKLAESELDPAQVALLQRPIESRLQGFKKLKVQQDFDKERDGQHETASRMLQRQAEMEEHKKQQVSELMKKYQELFREGKFKEAKMAATQAHDLDPENVAAGAAVNVASMRLNTEEYHNIKEGKEEMFRKGLNDAETEGPPVNSRDPVSYDPDTWDRAKTRKAFPKEGWGITIKSEKEIEIERRLSLPISIDFRDTPLKDVIQELRSLTGINIVPDGPALEAENISLDRPVTMHLEGVSTKNALELVLHQAHLIYVIKNDVILVTTETYNRGKLVAKTYQVADLIIPVDNYTLPASADMAKTLEQVNARSGPNIMGSTPFLAGHSLPNGNQISSTNGAPSSGSASPGGSGDNGRRPGQTMEDQLIKMITSTIQPQTWSNVGGPGTIEYYPLGMALVINQTPDIQEQVGELLAALRRLQDVEVSVEVRFITISEAFYERIGIDFNLNVLTNQTKNSAQIIAQQFQPAGFNNTFEPRNFLVGLLPGGQGAPAGAYTSDLNIPISSGGSFSQGIPPFGGFPNALGQDGGLSLGLAFLSDVQVFMFMEAAQADRRTNVMQAPKLTLFNGQNATINIDDNQFFVTSVAAFQVNGQVVFSPTNNSFALGVQLSIQAVVSADRRYVRLSLNPNLNNLASPVTALFPITTFITPVFESGAQGQPVPFTAYVQQPNITSVRINTTVSVPDGGTVLLGGLKTLREGRNEAGPPILSKIPYISRLFKNVGYGREAESLLIMVTPRVIINEEEETRATGVGTGLGLPGGGEAAGPAGPAAPPTAPPR